MEDNRISIRDKYLRIGDLNIRFRKNSSAIHMEIPLAGMAFYYTGKLQADFSFIIEEQNQEEAGQYIWGSDQFAFPTYLYERKSGDYDWITKQRDRTPGMSVRISRDWTQFTLYEDHTGTNGERAFHELGSLFSYAVLNRHACVLHGVVMEYQGRGILVLARAGTGKTTHTRMWRDRNALIINGDRCLCRKQDGVWYAYGMPWSGSSGEYINRRVPVSCIVNLNRGEVNTVKPMPLYDRTICLMQRIFAPAWPGELQTRAFDLCDELAAEIPMLDFYCRPDPESVDVLEKAVMRYGKS